VLLGLAVSLRAWTGQEERPSLTGPSKGGGGSEPHPPRPDRILHNGIAQIGGHRSRSTMIDSGQPLGGVNEW
jgi:hypothetical protein